MIAVIVMKRLNLKYKFATKSRKIKLKALLNKLIKMKWLLKNLS